MSNQTVPEGYRRIVAWSDGHRVVVMGVPSDEGDEMAHNCDAMGCGQEHIIVAATLVSGDVPVYEALRLPPADPTPPLMAAEKAHIQERLASFLTPDELAKANAITAAWDRLREVYGCTDDEEVAEAARFNLLSLTEAIEAAAPVLRAALTAQLAERTAERDRMRAAVRGWHEAMCEYREGDVRGSVDKVHRAEAALVALLAAPTEG